MRHYVNPVITHSQLSNVARRSSNFTRIFPAPGTSQYDIFFQGDSLQLAQQQQQPATTQAKQWNKVLYRYLYDKTSELNEIINQIQKQQKLAYEINRRTSQVRLNMQQLPPPEDDEVDFERSPEKNDRQQKPVFDYDTSDPTNHTSQSGAKLSNNPQQQQSRKLVEKVLSQQNAGEQQQVHNEIRSQSSLQTPNLQQQFDQHDTRQSVGIHPATMKTIEPNGGFSPLRSAETNNKRGQIIQQT